MSLIEPQWQQIEQQLDRGYCGTAKVNVDGRVITLQRGLIRKNQIGIEVYIDGFIQIGWGMPKSEHYDPFVEKVWCKRSRSVYGKKEKVELIKIFGKRGSKKRFKLDQIIEWYEPIFTCFGPIKRQYKKIPDIEFISAGYTPTPPETEQEKPA